MVPYSGIDYGLCRDSLLAIGRDILGCAPVSFFRFFVTNFEFSSDKLIETFKNNRLGDMAFPIAPLEQSLKISVGRWQ